MKKEDFIKWLKDCTSFNRCGNSDDSWEDLMNYAEIIYDYLEVYDNYVDFTYKNMYWGGSNLVKTNYSFEEFIRKYENYSLK